MIKGYVRPAQEADVPTVAADMRDADVAEVLAATGKTPVEALFEGLHTRTQGGKVLTICLPDGTPVGMYGVSPVSPGVGAVWMLAANGIKSIQRQFITESPSRIEDLCQGYRVVFNFTDARNKVHHRWIEWAGFTIIKRHPDYGHEKRPFLEFCRIVEDTHV